MKTLKRIINKGVQSMYTSEQEFWHDHFVSLVTDSSFNWAYQHALASGFRGQARKANKRTYTIIYDQKQYIFLYT